GDLGGRLLDRRHQPRVLVADVDVDQLGGEVQVGVAQVVPDVRAGSPRERERVQTGLGAPAGEDVAAGRLADAGVALLVDGRVPVGHRPLLQGGGLAPEYAVCVAQVARCGNTGVCR